MSGHYTTVTVNTVCIATVNETWTLRVPPNVEIDEDDVLALIGTPGVEIISCTDEASDEHDREVVSYEAWEES